MARLQHGHSASTACPIQKNTKKHKKKGQQCLHTPLAYIGLISSLLHEAILLLSATRPYLHFNKNIKHPLFRVNILFCQPGLCVLIHDDEKIFYRTRRRLCETGT